MVPELLTWITKWSIVPVPTVRVPKESNRDRASPEMVMSDDVLMAPAAVRGRRIGLTHPSQTPDALNQSRMHHYSQRTWSCVIPLP